MTKDNRHANILRDSDEATLEFINAIYPRLQSVFQLHKRIHGTQLIPELTIKADFELWNAVITRHKLGDRRHTEDEAKALKRIAQWTLDINSSLRNQPIQKIF